MGPGNGTLGAVGRTGGNGTTGFLLGTTGPLPGTTGLLLGTTGTFGDSVRAGGFGGKLVPAGGAGLGGRVLLDGRMVATGGTAVGSPGGITVVLTPIG